MKLLYLLLLFLLQHNAFSAADTQCNGFISLPVNGGTESAVEWAVIGVANVLVLTLSAFINRKEWIGVGMAENVILILIQIDDIMSYINYCL